MHFRAKIAILRDKKDAEEMQEIARLGQEIVVKTKVDIEVLLDPQMLRNVIINLISNAIKYSPEGGTIEVAAKLTGDTVSFSVRDEGMGIPVADQPHMFGRFFRASNATNIQGTGLGLNIVRKYLDLMGGTIYFKSREHEGTTFFVEIPQIAKP